MPVKQQEATVAAATIRVANRVELSAGLLSAKKDMVNLLQDRRNSDQGIVPGSTTQSLVASLDAGLARSSLGPVGEIPANIAPA
jgi:hypothetical protein